MIANANLSLRVNGIPITSLTLRKQIQKGEFGRLEVVITDPVLGQFAIDDSFLLEANDQLVSVEQLLKLIVAEGVLR